MSEANDPNSIRHLLGDALNQLSKLLSNEIQLARAELAQKLGQAGKGAAFIAASAVVLIPVIVLLLISLAMGLIQLGMSPLAGHLIAAFAGGAVSFTLAMVGVSYLKVEHLMPKVTIEQLKRDADIAKELAQ